MTVKLKVNDVVVLKGTLGPVGRITKIRKSTSTPSAEVYWGAQDHRSHLTKNPLTTLDLLVYAMEDAEESLSVTPPE